MGRLEITRCLLGVATMTGHMYKPVNVTYLIWTLFIFLAAIPMLADSQPRLETLKPSGEQPYIINPSGKKTPLYKYSYALVVSMSNYQNQAIWPALPNTESEGDKLSELLQKNGFEVRRVHDQSIDVFESEIKNFITKKAMIPDSRILFFYSGHGHYDKDTDKAYLVPVDGVSPTSEDFYSKSYLLDYIRVAASEIKATHALFIFDNCYSGIILRSASLIPDPRSKQSTIRFKALTENSKYKVTQFISSGGAMQQVPSTSIFLPILLQGLQGAASTERDGYVTGKELALFVTQHVLSKGVGDNKQIPGSAVVNNVMGDMVFQYRDVTSDPPILPIENPPITPYEKNRVIPEDNAIQNNRIREQQEEARRTEYALCKNQKDYLPKATCEARVKEFGNE